MNKISMQPVCVGRMLVDLPKGGQMDWQQQFDHATVERLPLTVNTSSAFWAYVNQRKAELEKPTGDNPKGRIFKYEKVGDNLVVVLLRPHHVDDSYIHTERYLWLEHEGYEYKTGTLSDAKAMELLSAIKRDPLGLTSIDNFRPPQEPGFCIDGALVAGKIGPIVGGVADHMKNWKGVSVNAGASEDDGTRAKLSWEKAGRHFPVPSPFDDLGMIKSWADESKKSSEGDRVVSLETLRKANRQLAGMSGEEIAVKVKLANGQEWYRFEWDSTGDAGGANKAGFSLGLFAGNKDYSSNYVAPPPQDDLLALWDAMLASLRRRPGAG